MHILEIAGWYTTLSLSVDDCELMAKACHLLEEDCHPDDTQQFARIETMAAVFSASAVVSRRLWDGDFPFALNVEWGEDDAHHCRA